MSVTKVYAVLDIKLGEYLSPMHFASPGVAERALNNAVNAKEGEFASHPADFALYELGSFDSVTGKFDNHPNPVHIVNAISLVRTSE